ncbi:ATP-binding cassette domain-containing protein [Francisella tularensis subsp. novicida]|uniref:cysteine peptidase family C39 domain-containing protein n=1 Tax=Francisella tularensis TaxID=263 RepID=UPI0008FCEA0D|nr:cysteine peptidase family C39 domain-containing protein [Francisella tularensis]APC95054.1 ABC transporter family protein [Francisella tularensis subsp. novicida]MBK2345783.1 ATP-binding cassette domain-containing protein [Francisella tularensis subsp. novicida]
MITDANYSFVENIKPKRFKTPTILQMDAIECGAAALKMILDYYKCFISMDDLRYYCDVNRDGSKALNIVRTAREFGFESSGFKYELDNIADIELPAIIFWDFNHYVVLEGFNKKFIYLNDPAIGRRKITWKEFDEGFTGVVLTFKPVAPATKRGKKQSILRSAFKRLKNSHKEVIFLVCMGIICLAFDLVWPMYIKIFIDDYLIKGNKYWVLPLLWFMSLSALFYVLISYFKSYLSIKFDLKMYTIETSGLIRKLIRLPYSFFTQRNSGEIIQRLTLAPKIAQSVSYSIVQIILSFITILTFLSIMSLYDFKLTVIVVFFYTFVTVVNLLFGEKISYLSKQVAMETGKYFGATTANMNSINTLKSMGGELEAFNKIAGYQTKLSNANQKLNFYNTMIGIFDQSQIYLLIAIVFYFGGLNIMSGQMSIGMFIAYNSFMNSYSSSFSSLVNTYRNLKAMKGDLLRVDDIFDKKDDHLLVQQENSAAKVYEKLNGKIELKNISFGYTNRGPLLFKDFSLTVNPGEIVALVGGSGSGKSTILKMIGGIITPQSGQISIGGCLIENINRDIFAASVGIVDQDIMIFDGTVHDNITMWNKFINQEDIDLAIKDACFDVIVDSLSNGIYTRMEKGGGNLSGGENQRLEIARALATSPSILLMDEATSALDEKTEKLVNDAIIRRKCTTIISAHRPSSFIFADKILVFDNGNLVQSGKHDDLVRDKNGLYYLLVKDSL